MSEQHLQWIGQGLTDITEVLRDIRDRLAARAAHDEQRGLTRAAGAAEPGEHPADKSEGVANLSAPGSIPGASPSPSLSLDLTRCSTCGADDDGRRFGGPDCPDSFHNFRRIVGPPCRECARLEAALATAEAERDEMRGLRDYALGECDALKAELDTERRDHADLKTMFREMADQRDEALAAMQPRELTDAECDQLNEVGASDWEGFAPMAHRSYLRAVLKAAGRYVERPECDYGDCQEPARVCGKHGHGRVDREALLNAWDQPHSFTAICEVLTAAGIEVMDAPGPRDAK